MDDFEEDTHFCLKCHNTILGLENYVNHRKNNCKEEVKPSLPSELITADEEFALKADDFFSSLELQSSSKKLIQPSTSGKNSTGILTRSKIAVTKEPEPSKSGKNAWIGGHQLKELDCGDNHSKLIKAVANLERRKDDLGRNKELPTLQVYEETDEDSEEYESEDETSDEDAPPRNHTGGKWKPSSPIYWKGDDWRPPPPTFTGGKWKPTPTKRTTSPPPKKFKPTNDKDNDSMPPPTFTGSKWSQSKKQEYCTPPPEHTKGKWKPKWENNFPPPEHTKGKWKPENTSNSEISPNYTKGKWVPDSKSSDKHHNTEHTEDSPFRKSGGTVQYWCKPCDRRLASKIVYERHLKSEFHFKRTLRENEFEENMNFVKDERRTKRKIVETAKKIEATEVMKKKRVRRKNFEKCAVCNSKVNINTMGKHLISHYHCRKGDLTSEVSQNMVLNYIESIVQQSPFQCKSCNFYFNFHMDFLNHWVSEEHYAVIKDKSGDFLCSYCKFSCETNDDMFEHLLSEGHNEVVSVINRSVPIVIKRVNYKQCGTCDEKFLLNIQLKKHIEKYGHDTNENLKTNGFLCSICDRNFSSKMALQKHKKVKHNEKSFICGTCDLTFESAEDAKLHRNSEEHTYIYLEKKKSGDKRMQQKKCQYCSEIFDNFLKLKNHMKTEHTEFHSSCPKCGLTFAIPQELTVHLRTKSCKTIENPEKKHSCTKCTFSTDSTAQFLFHEALHEDPVQMFDDSSAHTSSRKPTMFYKCSICEKLYPRASLESHLRIHTKERPFSCNFCKATFTRKNNWLFHEKKHTFGKQDVKSKDKEDTSSPFLCSTCGASFKSKFILQQHMKIHTGKQYKCMESGCIFAGRSFGELKNHYQTHFGDRNFECSLCEYKGKTKQQLMRHMDVHDDIKKFKCPQCPFRGRAAHHLKRHSRIHTGCKPYSCPHCSYTCNSLENLRKHILSTTKHPGKTIYKCKFCESNPFQTNLFKDFKAHLYTAHPEKIDKEIGKETGLYKADKDSFVKLGNSNRSIQIQSPQGNREIITLNENYQQIIKIETTNSKNDDVLPLISLIVPDETACEGDENWSLVGCYDVEESGTLVPFNKGNEEALFEEHF